MLMLLLLGCILNIGWKVVFKHNEAEILCIIFIDLGLVIYSTFSTILDISGLTFVC